MGPVIPASPEVLEHHARLHERRCPGPDRARITVCPCGRAHLIGCRACGEVVFVALAPGGPPCAHALELLGDVA
jgi:hypothetical protein